MQIGCICKCRKKKKLIGITIPRTVSLEATVDWLSELPVAIQSSCISVAKSTLLAYMVTQPLTIQVNRIHIKSNLYVDQ